MFDLSEAGIFAAFPRLRGLTLRILAAVRTRALYAPYVERHVAEVRSLKREERLAIPDDFNFAAVPGLSLEMRQRLMRARPATLGGAGRLAGVTPAAVAALAVHLRARQARFT